MTEKHDSQSDRPRREFWTEVVCPTASGLEGFFWRLAWFVVIVCLLFSSAIFG
jgi:hypothetical protein